MVQKSSQIDVELLNMIMNQKLENIVQNLTVVYIKPTFAPDFCKLLTHDL